MLAPTHGGGSDDGDEGETKSLKIKTKNFSPFQEYAF